MVVVRDDPLRPLGPLDSIALEAEVARIGGKAAGLSWLMAQGFAVPPCWVIETGSFRLAVERYVPAGCAPQELLARDGDPETAERMARARERLLTAPLEPALLEALRRLWSAVQAEAPWGLAVRSSATCEDSAGTSMAGLATTVLGVRGADSLARAVRQVWASALQPQALGHLAARQVRDVSMAVVLQPVVPATASGVLFLRPPRGTDPAVWAEGQRLVNATLGLGVPIVNGEADPDVIRFSSGAGVIEHYAVAAKRQALIVGDDDGPRVEPVAAQRVHEPALSARALEALVDIAERLDRAPGVERWAQDVEFCVQGERIVLVQARPIVEHGFPTGGDERTVWSRANVGEALPGAATPLTWSVARDFSERGFRQAFGALGCTVPPGAVLVANVQGRFYLNMSQFMQIAAQVPGLDPGALLHVGGGRGAELLTAELGEISRAGFYARLPLTLATLAVEHATLGVRVRHYERRASARRGRRKRLELEPLSDPDLGVLLRQVRGDLDRTGVLMLACASASLASYLALETALRWWAPGREETLARSLTAAGGELESARPGLAIARLAVVARREPAIASRLRADQIRRVDELGDGELGRGFEAFIDEFGERAVREAELATPRWSEQPGPVLTMLSAAARDPAGDPTIALARARQHAEAALADLERRLSRVQRAALRALMGHARRTTELRECMRGWVTRDLGAIRRVVCEVDRRLVRASGLEPGAAFYCTLAELLAALGPRRLKLGPIVKLRHAEHLRDRQRPDPPVTFMGRPPPVVLPPAGDDIMHGLAASAGVVQGPARVMVDGELPTRLQPGEILVARTTDVGYTPLFLVAAGVVTELGGPLSHAALVAREYGVPAVVNVRGATRGIRDGQLLRVDGNRGTVERLPPASEQPGSWRGRTCSARDTVGE